VDWWATINEPLILVYGAYVGERWPPGLGSFRLGLQAAANLLRGHHDAYSAIKREHPQAQVGIVVNLPVVDPARDSIIDSNIARVQDWLMNGATLEAFERGRLPLALSAAREELKGGAGASDWFGLNYYGRHLIQFDRTRPDLGFGAQVQEGVRSERGDWGEIYPEGLTRGLRRLATFGKPLFVTENGIYDNHDTRRPSYLLRHLQATHDAIQEGADVRGYFHWSLVDNFEWAEGWSTRFGLLGVNPATQERFARGSARLYERVIRANGITEEMWREVEKPHSPGSLP
jgi:beta-glucosidase